MMTVVLFDICNTVCQAQLVMNAEYVMHTNENIKLLFVIQHILREDEHVRMSIYQNINT